MSLRSALVSLCFVALGSAPAAAADDFYLKGFGGLSLVQDASLGVSDPDISFRYSYDPGYVLGAAIGRDLTSRLSVEAEYAFRQARANVHAKIDDRSPQEPIFDTWQFGETVTSQSLMLNLLFSFDPISNGLIRPYVGAGIGGGVLDFGGDDTDPQFAWQLIAGASYDLNPRWSLFGETRWFKTDGGSLDQSGPFADDDFLDGGFESLDFMVGATYRF